MNKRIFCMLVVIVASVAFAGSTYKWNLIGQTHTKGWTPIWINSLGAGVTGIELQVWLAPAKYQTETNVITARVSPSDLVLNVGPSNYVTPYTFTSGEAGQLTGLARTVRLPIGQWADGNTIRSGIYFKIDHWTSCPVKDVLAAKQTGVFAIITYP